MILSESAQPDDHSLELHLLLAYARTSIDEATSAPIQSLLKKEINWPKLIETAIKHQVSALICWNLCGKFAQQCPANVFAELKLLLQLNTGRNSFLARELIKIIDLFQAHDISTIPYKGPVLAETAYGHPGLRSFADLDILVDEWDYHFKVNELLLSEGWTIIADYGWEKCFQNSAKTVQLDAHVDFTHHALPFDTNFWRLWRDSITVTVAGKEIRVMNPVDELLVLCLQLAKDSGEERSPPLIKVCDIAEQVRRHPNLEWKRLTAKARRLGVLRILFLGLRTADELIGIHLPEDVRAQGLAMPRLDVLVTHVRERVLGQGEIAFSHPELLSPDVWYSALRERVRDRSQLFQKAQSILRPNIFDYTWLPLPRKLRHFYYLIRPVRVAAGYLAKPFA